MYFSGSFKEEPWGVKVLLFLMWVVTPLVIAAVALS